jgi:hypothetical protein
MPEGLTQTKTPTFSETRPEIDRNGGRLQIGTVAGFTSEYPAGINRNPQSDPVQPSLIPWRHRGCFGFRRAVSNENDTPVHKN